MMLNPNIPSGPIEQAWDKARFDMKLVSPANKRRHSLIVVGSGLAGASASASLGELGYNLKCFLFSGLPSSGAFYRRSRRHQCGQELP